MLKVSEACGPSSIVLHVIPHIFFLFFLFISLINSIALADGPHSILTLVTITIISLRIFPSLPGSRLVCACVCILPLYSGRQVRWMYQPGSHKRKVTQDFSPTFLLRCMPLSFSQEGFSRPFLPGFSSLAVLGWWFDRITHVW